jgi:predicted SprT family Zn-dependent metalloprotease
MFLNNFTAMEHNVYACRFCGKKFNREDNLKNHERKHDAFQCLECPRAFTTQENLEFHQSWQHSQSGGGRKRRSESPQPGSANKQQKLDNSSDYYSITPIGEKKMRKFNTTATRYRVNFKDLQIRGLPDILKTLRRLFTSIVKEMTGKNGKAYLYTCTCTNYLK